MPRRRKTALERGSACLLLIAIGVVAMDGSGNETMFGFAHRLYEADAGRSVVFVGVLAAALFLGYFNYQLWRMYKAARGVRAIDLAGVDAMGGIEFEHYLAKLLKTRGYKVEVTPASGDLGVDLIVRRGRSSVAIQVKNSKNKISRRAVSDAVAGMKHYSCNSAMVVTNNFFEKGAVQLAASTQCELVNRNQLAQWIVEFQKSKWH